MFTILRNALLGEKYLLIPYLNSLLNPALTNDFIIDYAAVFINACCLLIVFLLDVRRPWVPWKAPLDKMYYYLLLLPLIMTYLVQTKRKWSCVCAEGFVPSHCSCQDTLLHIILRKTTSYHFYALASWPGSILTKLLPFGKNNASSSSLFSVFALS